VEQDPYPDTDCEIRVDPVPDCSQSGFANLLFTPERDFVAFLQIADMLYLTIMIDFIKVHSIEEGKKR
jgi:hypothetical protein